MPKHLEIILKNLVKSSLREVDEFKYLDKEEKKIIRNQETLDMLKQYVNEDH